LCTVVVVHFALFPLQTNFFVINSKCSGNGEVQLQRDGPSSRADRGVGDSRAVFVVGPAGRPARPRKEHDCHHDKKVKPEAATAVIELLMMGGKSPKHVEL
jgi:hypothetical protein